MSAFTATDLSKLPAPQVVARKDFEQILAEVKAWLIDRDPGLAPVINLESEPIVKVLEAWAYREMLLRAEFDDAGRGNMLAYAVGAQLDQLAAFYGVQRLVIQPADLTTVPAVPEILEADDRFRARIQMALEGYSTAGPRGAYQYWGLSASPLVKDVSVVSPVPGQVVVTVLSTEGDGSPSAELLTLVSAQLNDEDIRPITDQVVVQAASIEPYSVSAVLTLYEGPDSSVVEDAALEAVEAYVSEVHRLGHDVTRSGIFAALHQRGVQNVALASPASDIVVGSSQAAFCSAINVTVGGRDV